MQTAVLDVHIFPSMSKCPTVSVNSGLSDSGSVTNHTAWISAADKSLQEGGGGVRRRRRVSPYSCMLMRLMPVGKITAHTTAYVGTYKQPAGWQDGWCPTHILHIQRCSNDHSQENLREKITAVDLLQCNNIYDQPSSALQADALLHL